MSIRVLHLAWDGGLGGVQRYLLKVIGSKHWKDSEHAICFYADIGDVINHQTMPGTRIWSLKLNRGYDFIASRQLNAIVASYQPDVIHCHCDTPAFLPQLIKRGHARLIFHEHGDTIMRRERSWVTSALWRTFGLRWASIIANSDYVRRDFVRRYDKLEPRCHVLHNPLLEVCSPVRQANARPVIGVFSRMAWQKGVDRILELMPALLEKVPGLELHYYGHGEMQTQLMRRVVELGIGQSVSFKGYVDNPVMKMAQMDVVVIPSRIEPFGLVALEAQSVSTPVVAFDQTGVSEIVRHRETGFIVHQDHPMEMVHVIHQLIQNPILREQMGQAARKYVLSAFSLKRHNASLEEMYHAA